MRLLTIPGILEADLCHMYATRLKGAYPSSSVELKDFKSMVNRIFIVSYYFIQKFPVIIGKICCSKLLLLYNKMGGSDLIQNASLLDICAKMKNFSI